MYKYVYRNKICSKKNKKYEIKIDLIDNNK